MEILSITFNLYLKLFHIAYRRMEANITLLSLDVVFNGQYLFYKNTYSVRRKYVIQFKAQSIDHLNQRLYNMLWWCYIIIT